MPEWLKEHLPGAISFPCSNLIRDYDPSICQSRVLFIATTAASILLKESSADSGILIDGVEGWSALGLDKVTIPGSAEDQDEVEVLLPEQVIALLDRLPYPAKVAVLLVASTGVRISECLGLTWKHIEWANNRIFIHQTFRRGEMQNRTKTRASNAPVPMCVALAAFLADWRQQTPYDKDEDFIFASAKLKGKQPLWGQTVNADFVKPPSWLSGW